jgi:hypothetical protein
MNIPNTLEMKLTAEYSEGESPKSEEIKVISNSEYKIIICLFILSQLWTLLLTFIPVVGNVKPENFYDKRGWNYSGSDIIRFIEPVGSLPINFSIFLKSDIFIDWEVYQYNQACIFLWMISAAVCQQGAGFHSAFNMIKNAYETLPIYTNPTDDGQEEFYYYIRNRWQHLYSHYLYAAGYAAMAVVDFFKNKHNK